MNNPEETEIYEITTDPVTGELVSTIRPEYFVNEQGMFEKHVIPIIVEEVTP